jgi:membrane-associated phospholipid phosphatase
MSIARVAVGVHWPMDILAGWVIGIIAAYLARYIPERLINFVIKIQQKIIN